MTVNLLGRTVEILREHPGQQFTTNELARLFIEKYPDICRMKLENSRVLKSEEDLQYQLSAEISAGYERLFQLEPKARRTEGRPRKFYYPTVPTEQFDDNDSTMPAIVANQEAHVNTPREHALYPLLSEYLLLSELNVHSMRIDEKRSSKSRGPGGNHWLFPDVVGIEDLTAGWHEEVKACVVSQAERRALLWSFEVKVSLDRSILRQAFFQAVSNSSWANYGYLVAAEIASGKGDDTMKELRMLSAAHGIGVILLNDRNPVDSQILIPARERQSVDWDVANRLAGENRDFCTYVEAIRIFHEARKLVGDSWYRPRKNID